MENKINIKSVAIENFGGIKDAITIEEIGHTGLIVIFGKSGQGKTSLLNAIATTLGGKRLSPTDPVNHNAEKAKTCITLSDGTVVTGNFQSDGGSRIVVKSPNGMTGGITALKEIISEHSLKLPLIDNMSNKERRELFLKTFGVDTAEIDAKAKNAYDERRIAGRALKDAETVLASMIYHNDVPKEELSISELNRKLMEANAHNSQYSQLENQLNVITNDYKQVVAQIKKSSDSILDLEQKLAEAKEEHDALEKKRDEIVMKGKNSRSTLEGFTSVDTSEIHSQMESIEETNTKVRENKSKKEKEKHVKELTETYNGWEEKLKDAQAEKEELLKAANSGVEGLSVSDDDICFNGVNYNSLATSEQYRCKMAIAKAENPNCGFVLVDRLECLDAEQRDILDKECQEWGMQMIGTVVSSGSERGFVMEEGKLKINQ